MKLGMCLRNRLPIQTIIRLAQRAEHQGFHSVWITEGTTYKDVITQMAAVACHTSRIKIGSGIIPIWTRTPVILGNSFIALDELSEGRAILGVGSGHPKAMRDFHGIVVDKPVGRMREYLEVIRLLFQNDTFTYEGKQVQIRGYSGGFKPLHDHLPVYIAALNPQMLRLAGAIADGVLMNVVTPQYVVQAKGIVMEAAIQSGRDPQACALGSFILCSLDNDATRALGVVQNMIAQYARDEFYDSMLRRAGFSEVLDKMAAPLRRGDTAAAGRCIPGDVASALAMYGPLEACRRTLEAFERAGVELAVFHPQFPAGADLEQGIGDLIDAFGTH